MDNRITKKRLSDFLSYDWIIMIVAAVAVIILWELIYSIVATRLSVGQQFKYYIDEDFYSYNMSSIYDVLGVNSGENGKTFSYDVLSVDAESLNKEYNVLSVRLSVQEGDAIFTSSVINEEDQTSRVKTVIDGNSVYDFNSLLNSAKDYLSQFKDGDAISEAKIRAYFDERMQGDKRFKTDDQKEEGRINEIGRIVKLASDVKDFEKLLKSGNQNLFYKYVKYEQASNGDENDGTYGAVYQKEKAKGELVYGLNMGALSGGKQYVSDYLKLKESDSAENVVLLLFDFSSYQYDLQFESISFTITLVKEFSNILG